MTVTNHNSLLLPLLLLLLLSPLFDRFSCSRDYVAYTHCCESDETRQDSMARFTATNFPGSFYSGPPVSRWPSLIDSRTDCIFISPFLCSSLLRTRCPLVALSSLPLFFFLPFNSSTIQTSRGSPSLVPLIKIFVR